MPKMTQTLLLALLPAAIWSLAHYGLRSLVLLGVTCATAVVAEFLFQRLARRRVTIRDGSALATGLLLGLSLSPSLPPYAAAAGAAVGIVLAKQMFGGFGRNILNPALAGRLFIVYAFPNHMEPWLQPVELVTAATPLQVLGSGGQLPAVGDLFLGMVPGSIGETSSLLLLLGGSYLMLRGYANWRIPAACLGVVAFMALVAGQDPFFHLFSGSIMLGALFMATDPVTSPRTQSGRWIFGAGVGLITMSMRLWGWLPEGTTFAILIMNLLVPVLNHQTRVKPRRREEPEQ